LEEILLKPLSAWLFLWKHLKAVVKDAECLNNIINITNACINLGHWPSGFKSLSLIIIPEPNKTSYNSSKPFHPIARKID